MKRQKRNTSDRAFHRGYKIGVSGRSKDLCPHTSPNHRQAWLTGWREGRTDKWDSLVGISGIQQQTEPPPW